MSRDINLGAARRRIGDFDASRHRQDGIRCAEGKSADQCGRFVLSWLFYFDVVICCEESEQCRWKILLDERGVKMM